MPQQRRMGLVGIVPLGASVDLILAHDQVKRTRSAAVDDGFNRRASGILAGAVHSF